MAWFTKVIEAVAVWATWFFSPKQVAKREQADADKAAAEAAEAVRNRDTDKVNDILRRSLAFPLIAFVTCTALATPGCATNQPPVYIYEADKVVPIVHEGCQGWFVPAKVMEMMLAKLAGGAECGK